MRRILVRATHDVSRYLATKDRDIPMSITPQSRYARRLPIATPNSSGIAPSIYSLPDPAGYSASAIWLLARHGTRWPTAQRMRQINSLTSTFKDVSNTDAFPWVKDWTSPVAGMMPAAGELHPIGEEELWSLGVRLRQRFPGVLRSAYLPRRHSIVATQVPRTSASASAFAAGFFPHRRGMPLHDHLLHPPDPHLGPQAAGPQAAPHLVDAGIVRPQAVAIDMAPKGRDPLLRFYDVCPVYAQREVELEQWLVSWLMGEWSQLAPAVSERLGLRGGRQLSAYEVDALWTLCQVEAGLQGEVGRACRVFAPDEVARMEWLDDVDLLEAHGWGSQVNYRIAAPLLRDLRRTLQAAAAASRPGGLGDDGPHARLLFAHCETLVPLATLLGLFEPELPAPPSAAQRGAPPGVKVPSQREAQQMLGEVDSLEDLPLVAGAELGAPHPPAAGRKAPSEGVDTSRPPLSPGVPPAGVAPPAGWYPRTPFDEGRVFRGGRVSPYGANMTLVLYARAGGGPGVHGAGPSHLVRLLYNEQVVGIPGCSPVASSGHDYDLEEFLAVTAGLAEEAAEQQQQQVPPAA